MRRGGRCGHDLAAAAATAVLAGGAITAYTVALRPWHLRWGVTAAEVARSLPGDELVADPSASATHAITIHAPAEDI